STIARTDIVPQPFHFAHNVVNASEDILREGPFPLLTVGADSYPAGLFACSTLGHWDRRALIAPSTWMTAPSVATPRSTNKLKKAKQLSGTASASNKSRFMAKCVCLWLRRPTDFEPTSMVGRRYPNNLPAATEADVECREARAAPHTRLTNARPPLPWTISPAKIMKNTTAAVIGPQSSSRRHGSGHRLSLWVSSASLSRSSLRLLAQQFADRGARDIDQEFALSLQPRSSMSARRSKSSWSTRLRKSISA